jgi:hypothetical protein
MMLFHQTLTFPIIGKNTLFNEETIVVGNKGAGLAQHLRGLPKSNGKCEKSVIIISRLKVMDGRRKLLYS